MENQELDDFKGEDALGNHLRRYATRFEPSASLKASLRAQVALKAAAQTAAPNNGFGGVRTLAWRSAAAGMVVGVMLTMVIGFMLRPNIDSLVLRPSLESDLVASHVNSMGQGPLFQIASSDRHTVKPWFQGKLDFAPPVPDLAQAGFPLLGGRIEHIEGRTVAALAYARNKHIINVFIWPNEKVQAPSHSVQKGFNLSHWSDGAMQMWLVSDVDAAEIARFGDAWRRLTVTNQAQLE